MPMQRARRQQTFSMKAFAIYGKPDVGKSTACYKLYQLLIQSSARVIFTDPTKIENPSVSKNDFKVMLEYHGKKILITSDGDDCSIIANNIDKAIADNPDFFIFAVRSGVWYKASVTRLQAITQSPVNFLSLPPAQSDMDQNNNEEQIAMSIFNLLP